LSLPIYEAGDSVKEKIATSHQNFSPTLGFFRRVAA